jgi:uncharacterized protein
MAEDAGLSLQALVGNSAAVAKIKASKYESETLGALTLKDILDELKKPGRDPRETFTPPAFREDVCTIEDVQPGMKLEGVVTNVTAFGAFVDIGVHQDGLVHVSEIADRYVKDPAEVVKTGDRLMVTVLEVDLARKRISLSARKQPRPETRSGYTSQGHRKGGSGMRNASSTRSHGFNNNPFAGL